MAAKKDKTVVANNDRLLTILVAVLGILLTALLGGVGWIGVQVWDMNPKVTDTARRVDRIVDVLPEVVGS